MPIRQRLRSLGLPGRALAAAALSIALVAGTLAAWAAFGTGPEASPAAVRSTGGTSPSGSSATGSASTTPTSAATTAAASPTTATASPTPTPTATPGTSTPAAAKTSKTPAPTTTSKAPAPPAATGNVLQLDGGNYHTCMLMRAGSIYCWGQGAYGQLGTGTMFRGYPTKTLTIADGKQIAAGGRFTCALRASGEVWCWGDAGAGQLGAPGTDPCGDKTIDSTCHRTPRKVPGLPGKATAVTAGDQHACALVGGKVWCWGGNEYGQISGAGGDRMEPAAVPGLSGVTRISAGDEHTCALVGNPGRVWCWGNNEDGQAGGNSDVEPAPVGVAGIATAVEVSAGGAHTCARLSNGRAYCWGYNYLGQLGNGGTGGGTSQPQAVKNLTGAAQLATGRYHTCARKTDGTVWCWGLNRKGEIGDGTTTDRYLPTRVSGLTGATHVMGGLWHYCAAKSGSTVVCWGDNLGGQLGIGDVNSGANTPPVAVKQLPKA